MTNNCVMVFAYVCVYFLKIAQCVSVCASIA
jgi:hypothetical protein